MNFMPAPPKVVSRCRGRTRNAFSPEGFHGVPTDGRVCREDGQLLNLGLGDKKPVERVAVNGGQCGHAERVGERHREHENGVFS